ncbi:39S ribosomal protein L16, mitochondrial [Macrosteles quadrilineatus]|uniref:39S ribosomal protein L16, mitochondrial n=1 Tax=Macrosteles quadrilineatus TaxID=74068 RepID=UPI0023E1D800|nr:39S ribosomal protein L16, mitochondrial [Macrosteles quadrilineatus]
MYLTNFLLTTRPMINYQFLVKQSSVLIQIAGLKNFRPPPDFSHIEIPERQRLTVVPKVPTFPPGLRPPKMQKNLKFMKGPEEVHNKLIHKQYGIIALTGGRLKHGHFEMIRNTLGRKIDTKRMFLIWRVDPPWQPVTKKGQGMRMGGGKGPIDHYVTPVKARRVIVELGGRCEFAEVQKYLHQVAHILPFKAMAVSHEMLEEMEAKEKLDEARNLNEYTMEYIIKNNLGHAKLWCRRNDYKYFGKFI